MMARDDVSTRSLRALKMQALAPRVLLYGVLTILAAGGVRAAVTGPGPRVTMNRIVEQSPDFAAMTFAESFARAYLTWNGHDATDQRAQVLAAYISSSLDPDAGVSPASGTSETVLWTSVAGIKQATDGSTLVTVAAQTDKGLIYLSVPVAQDGNGSMAIASYPALVGPPPTDQGVTPADSPVVSDAGLTTVVDRALSNYLAGSRTNLAADLAPSTVVSLPQAQLHVQSFGDVTWVEAGRRVSVQLTATDGTGTSWTLQYELGVVWSGRWYVSSIQVDPRSEGG